ATGQIVGISTQAPGNNKPVNPFVSNISYSALQQPTAWSWLLSNGAIDQAARSFDTAGRMSANEFASYQYDAAGRITAIAQNLAAVSTTQTQTSEFQTHLTWQVSYDTRGRITGFNQTNNTSNTTASPKNTTAYTYDANSNRLTSIAKITSDSDLDGLFEATDRQQTTAQAQQIAANSNRLLGFSQTMTATQGIKTGKNAGSIKTLSTSTAQVSYGLDAAGNLTTDGLRDFAYDARNRHSQTSLSQLGGNGESAKITYLHNALGQRVFKSEPQIASTAPSEEELGVDFVAWLKKNYAWMFEKAQTNATIGQSYVYADGALPEYALLAEYGNGAASGAGRFEYIWLPTEAGSAIPIGLFKSNRLYSIHSDHLNTPRLVKDDDAKPVWQWPYSAFGDNKPTGVLKATAMPNNALTQDATTNAQLKATTPSLKLNLRYPGQYFDEESNLNYNYNRSYMFGQGRYSQSDPIGLGGGWNTYTYAVANPFAYIDPTGLDIVVITGGRREATNPFGHSALGVTGAGVYSYGNGTSLGSSVTSYVTSQSQYRNQQIIVIPTTPEQDAAALKNLYGQGCKNCVGYFDNCAIRTNSALEATGLRTGATGFPGSVARGAAGLPGAQIYTIPRGGPIPQVVIDALRQFTPTYMP
ncbi:MAG: RHS repeat-associated core domain-containing protein, partial [Burkholderiaceae bacterium]